MTDFAGTPRRIGAVILRHWYLIAGSWPRFLDLCYWPLVQMILWGFITDIRGFDEAIAKFCDLIGIPEILRDTDPREFGRTRWGIALDEGRPVALVLEYLGPSPQPLFLAGEPDAVAAILRDVITPRAAWIAASRGDMPSSIWCSTASTTTIASSTTIPIARTKANNVNRFNEYPNKFRKKKAQGPA